MNSFDLSQHELSGKEIHRNLPASVLYEHAIRYEKEATIAENGACRVLGREDWPFTQGQTHRQEFRLRKRRLVGDDKRSTRSKVVQDSPPACP